jgi:hypothetical protein
VHDLQIVGRQRDDATVLRAAAAYEAAAPWKDKWPPMLAQMGLYLGCLSVWALQGAKLMTAGWR